MLFLIQSKEIVLKSYLFVKSMLSASFSDFAKIQEIGKEIWQPLEVEVLNLLRVVPCRMCMWCTSHSVGSEWRK